MKAIVDKYGEKLNVVIVYVIDTILAKTFGSLPSGEMLKSMYIINSLPDR